MLGRILRIIAGLAAIGFVTYWAWTGLKYPLVVLAVVLAIALVEGEFRGQK